MSLWNKKLEDQLKKVWADEPKHSLLAKFPDFTYDALRKKAMRLGLHRAATQELRASSDEQILKRVETLGYQVVKHPQVTDKVFDLSTERFRGDTVRIGIVSDTHLGSKHQQLTYLKQIYQYFAELDIKIVLHGADLLEGNGFLYRGQNFEMFVHGADEQVDYAINNYPRVKGIKTYIISGNHDLSFFSQSGVDVVKKVCQSREDMGYIGQYSGFINLPGNMLTYLLHGAGANSYARSYKLQKIVENFSSENKPKLFIMGHYHITNVLPNYRNVFSMLPGCFQSQTPFLTRLGLSPDVGGWVLEYCVNDYDIKNGLTRIKAEWIPFMNHIPNDY